MGIVNTKARASRFARLQAARKAWEYLCDNPRTFLMAIVVVAFAIRVYVVTGPVSWFPHTIDSTFGHYIVRGMRVSGAPGPIYDGMAKSLLAGRGLVYEADYPKRRSPLYPVLLAGIYWLSGESLLAVGFFHAVLGALTCLFIWLLTREAFGVVPAMLAASVAAFLPEFLKYTPRLYDSTLLVFLCAAFLYAASWARRSRKAFAMVLPGLLLVLVIACRLELVVLVPGFTLWLLWDGASWKERIARVSVLIILAVIVIGPWLAYTGTPSVERLLEAGGGSKAWIWRFNNPYLRTCWEDPPEGLDRGQGFAEREVAQTRIEESLGTRDGQQIQHHFGQLALTFITHHPFRVLELMFSRILILWNIWPTPPPSLWLFGAFWAFLTFAIIGAVATRHSPETRLSIIVIISVTLLYGFLHGHPRYRIPAMPSVIILFALGVAYAFRGADKKSSRVSTRPTARREG